MSFLLRSILLCILVMPVTGYGKDNNLKVVLAEDIPDFFKSDNPSKDFPGIDVHIKMSDGSRRSVTDFYLPTSYQKTNDKYVSIADLKDWLSYKPNLSIEYTKGIHMATLMAQTASFEHFKMLHENGMPVDVVGKKGINPFFNAYTAGNKDLLKYLIPRTNLNVFYKMGAELTPLYLVISSYPDLVKDMLDAGADPNLPLLGAEMRPLDAAVQTQPHVISSLLKAGADPNRIFDFPGLKGKISTMIWASMSSCHASQELLNANISKKVINMPYAGHGTPPIMYALYRIYENKIADRKYCKGLIQKMLEAGADPNPPKNKKGFTPLTISKKLGLKNESKIIQNHMNKIKNK